MWEEWQNGEELAEYVRHGDDTGNTLKKKIKKRTSVFPEDDSVW